MKYLFAPAGQRALATFCERSTLFAFDFDGTLAPLVADPLAARMSPKATELAEAIGKLAPVALVTGRSSTDLKSRLDFAPAFLIGNHGLESDGKNSAELERAAETCRKWRQLFPENLAKWPGSFIEDKKFSFSIHSRKARNAPKFRKELAAFCQSLEPLPRLLGGKHVLNLVPPGSPNKGSALLALMKRTQIERAIYVGDDLTDEDVFSMEEPSILSIRVGRRTASKAEYYVQRQTQVNRLLNDILRLLDRK